MPRGKQYNRQNIVFAEQDPQRAREYFRANSEEQERLRNIDYTVPNQNYREDGIPYNLKGSKRL